MSYSEIVDIKTGQLISSGAGPTDNATRIALNCLLDDWYAASVLSKGDARTLVQHFDDQAKVYPKLRELAQARRDELRGMKALCNGDLDKRCFISHTHLQYLERVLTNEQTS